MCSAQIRDRAEQRQKDGREKKPVCAPLRHLTGKADEQDHQEQRYGTYIEINNAHGSIPQSRIVLAQRAPISNDDPNSAVRPARLEFAICPAVTGDRLNLFRNHRDNTAYPDILGPNPPLLLRTQAFFLYPVPVRHAQIRRI